MKKIISLVLLCSIVLCGCSNSKSFETEKEQANYKTELNTKIDTYLIAMENDYKSIETMLETLNKSGRDISEETEICKNAYERQKNILNNAREIPIEQKDTAFETADKAYEDWYGYVETLSNLVKKTIN